ncbi:uncharacterized protein [Atheta coriaria]|uniref:uncharacterized protein n=1 Tax=Dalotia coriaria TaxID=877792 RepID=UPI0031F35D7D
MDSKSLNQLYIISFLDSFCTGLTLPVLNNYIVVGLKGSHFLLGLLSMVQVLSQIIISPLLSPVTMFVGARNLLLFSHVMTFFNYLIVIIANDYRLFLLFRMPFFFFNQTQYSTDVLIAKTQQTTGDHYVRQLKNVAFILGPFCGGLLYHDTSILCVASMINILTTLSLVLAYKLPQDNITTNIQLPSPPMSKLWQSSWRECWKSKSLLSMVKILTTIGLSCFFIKFTLVMTANLNASASLIGFTIAMHNLIFHSAKFACQLLNNSVLSIQKHIRQLLLTCLLVMTIAMYILCRSHDYGEYLLAFVGLAMSREMFERLWGIEADSMTKNSMECLQKLITCVLPVVLGAYCDLYSHRAVQTLAVVPLIFATLLGFKQLAWQPENSKMKVVEQQIMKSFNLAISANNKKHN